MIESVWVSRSSLKLLIKPVAQTSISRMEASQADSKRHVYYPTLHGDRSNATAVTKNKARLWFSKFLQARWRENPIYFS